MAERELVLNFKAMMMFEKLTGESYFQINDQNYIYILYTMYISNNPHIYMTMDNFVKVVLNNKKIFKRYVSEWSEKIFFLNQFYNAPKNEEDSKSDGDNKPLTITDIAFYLITKCGIDPHYVMYEMELWEIEPFIKWTEENHKDEWERERLWTYFNIMPHIDSKKCKSPDKLFPFPWEKENIKKKTEQELKNNEYAIKNMIGKSIFGDDDIEDGSTK